MNEHRFARVRAQRPTPPPPSYEVVRQAKENLMHAIQEAERSDATPRIDQARRPKRRINLTLVAASALIVAGLGTAVVTRTDTAPTTPIAISSSGTPAQTLEQAAQLVAYKTGDVGSGAIRYERFRNESDPGNPVYERYIRPDGTALVGELGRRLEESDGFYTSAELAALPSNPKELRPALRKLAIEKDLALPGDPPVRAMFRLSTDLLTDPGVSPKVKAGIYRVLKDLDLKAIKAKNLGKIRDSNGRKGIGISFQFDEGATETFVLDRDNGSLLSDTTVLADGTPFAGQVYLKQRLVKKIPNQH